MDARPTGRSNARRSQTRAVSRPDARNSVPADRLPAHPLTSHERVDPSLGDRRVLIGRHPAAADRADDLAVDGDWHAPGHGNRALERKQPLIAALARIRKNLRRPAESRGRAGFLDRDVHAADLDIVHTVKQKQRAMRIDYSDG